MPDISAEFTFTKRHVPVLASEMAYVEAGDPAGVTVVFLHGNPTSSYLWRNVIPHVAAKARCVAPDLIGMGDSGKLPRSAYGFAEHARYLEAFLDAVVPQGKLVLVLHDWGSGLGFDWASRHEDRLAGLAFMEFVRPWRTWEEFPDAGRELFRALRSPASGRKLAIDDNIFVEQFLPGGVVRKLSEAEMSHYRAPFLDPADREILYRFPNDAPIAGEPPDVYALVEAYHDWLLASDVPKLLFHAQPGVVITVDVAEWYTKHLRKLHIVDLGPGLHYVQEDNPHEIGREIAAWLPQSRRGYRMSGPSSSGEDVMGNQHATTHSHRSARCEHSGGTGVFRCGRSLDHLRSGRDGDHWYGLGFWIRSVPSGDGIVRTEVREAGCRRPVH